MAAPAPAPNVALRRSHDCQAGTIVGGGTGKPGAGAAAARLAKCGTGRDHRTGLPLSSGGRSGPILATAARWPLRDHRPAFAALAAYAGKHDNSPRWLFG